MRQLVQTVISIAVLLQLATCIAAPSATDDVIEEINMVTEP